MSKNMEIEKHFCTYKQSLDLKKLGFDEECLGLFVRDESLLLKQMPNQQECELYFGGILAPLKSQAFEFFREKFGLDGYIFSNKSGRFTIVVKKLFFVMENLIKTGQNIYDSYEEAENACIDKLIEICNENKSYE